MQSLRRLASRSGPLYPALNSSAGESSPGIQPPALEHRGLTATAIPLPTLEHTAIEHTAVKHMARAICLPKAHICASWVLSRGAEVRGTLRALPALPTHRGQPSRRAAHKTHNTQTHSRSVPDCSFGVGCSVPTLGRLYALHASPVSSPPPGLSPHLHQWWNPCPLPRCSHERRAVLSVSRLFVANMVAGSFARPGASSASSWPYRGMSRSGLGQLMLGTLSQLAAACATPGTYS
jgi:hypothetical protein